jgi:hypothetical protein
MLASVSRTIGELVRQNIAMPRDNASRQRSPQQLLHAGDLFADRIDESVVLTRTLAAHREYMDTDEDVSAAKNILVFYGVGGIGKTSLSERLEDWLNGELPSADEWGTRPAIAVAATCRIDLYRSQGRVDVVDAVMTIRRAFGKIRKRWTAFDLAFATYWSAINPGEKLPVAGDDGEFADGVSNIAIDLLSESGIPLAGIATRSIRAVMREVRSHAIRQGAFARYQGFEELLQRCGELPTPDDPHFEMLGDIVALLNTDLCDWNGTSAPIVAVFVDTFERLTADPRRVDESTLNQLVWQLPNVLFIVTGRNMLDWYDEKRTNLYIVGRSVWPGLVPGATDEPRQHLVGNLAFEDRLRIIERGRELYRIRIDDAVVNELAAASGGLPQYLDLALALALTKTLNGDDPISVADVTGSLSELVERVLEDIPSDEQRALRAASLFPFFNSQIVAAAAQVDDGCARRAMLRPMIDHRGSQSFPHSMHDAIRVAIRASPHDIPNGWSARDWREAAEHGLAAIESLYRDADQTEDIPMAIETLGLAIRLVCDQDIRIGPASSSAYDDWMSQAIIFGPSIAGLRSRLPASSETTIGQGIIDFVVAKSTDVTVDQAVELLTRLFRSSHPLRLPAGRHRAYTLRNASRFEDAMAAFSELVEVAPTDLHRFQLVKTLATARRFRDATNGVNGLSRDRTEQIHRDCAVPHGRFENYFEPVLEKLARLRAKGRQREAIEDAGNVYRWQAFVTGDVQSDLLDELEDAAEAAFHLTGLREVYLAKLFLDPDIALRDGLGLAWFEQVDQLRNAGELGYRTAMARVALALYTDDHDALNEMAIAINSRVQRRGRLWVGVECAIDSLGYCVDTLPTQWLEPYDVVRTRWREHWDTWLRRVKP